jgi:hypothetical protein
MPVSPHRSGREFMLGMLVCEADPFHRSAALPLSAESSPLGSRCRAWLALTLCSMLQPVRASIGAVNEDRVRRHSLPRLRPHGCLLAGRELPFSAARVVAAKPQDNTHAYFATL